MTDRPVADPLEPDRPTMADLQWCFTGVVPAVLATADARGVPNITYLSRAHPVGDDRIALSNQFFSKSSRNLAENPRASLLLIRPDSYEEFRVALHYERTDRRGQVFEQLRNDLATVAALTGMEDVFELQAADIYRVVDIERTSRPPRPGVPRVPVTEPPGLAHIGELTGRLARSGDLDTLVRVTVDGLAELLGYEHSQLLLLDEEGTRLFSIASHGYDRGGTGAEIAVGDGPAGVAAERCAPVLVASVSQVMKYATVVSSTVEEAGGAATRREIPLAGLERPMSQLAVPAMALGRLIGVLLVESPENGRFTMADAGALSVIGGIAASSIETLRAEVRTSGAPTTGVPVATPSSRGGPVLHVRHYAADGSTFLDGDYLIKGVAGRLLWSLLRQHRDEGRTDFTNREVRLDPTLDLPDFRDNFESRLILLKRRLDERDAPVRITKTGRGRFRLDVDGVVRLESMET